MTEHFQPPEPDPYGSAPGPGGTERYPGGGWPQAPAPPPGTSGPGWAQQPPHQQVSPQPGYDTPRMGEPPFGTAPEPEQPTQQVPPSAYPPPDAFPPDAYGPRPAPPRPGPYGSPPPYPGWGPPPQQPPQPPPGYPGAWYPQPSPRPERHPARIAILLLSVVAIAAVVGIVIGRAVSTPTSHTALPNPFTGGPTIPVGPDAGGGGSGGDQGGNGGNQGGDQGGGPSSGNSNSQGGPSNVPQIAAKVDPGLVDVNTTLGYQSARAAGTGIVLTPNGVVLTNNHVINGATKITVTDIGNGKTYPAAVVGYDRTHDVAVLQVSGASGLKTSTIGDSTKVTIGQQIVAIGNAGGVGGTPSTAGGTVSGLNEAITASDDSDNSSEQLTGLIQVDANVQPGDSGGPLVNTGGEVIGVDTAASAAPGGSGEQGGGEGYAIPIKQAMSIGDTIRAGTGSATVHIGKTGFLGVEAASDGQGGGQGGGQASPDTTAPGDGATVQDVIPGSPAQVAGLAGGDVIISLNGQNVDSATTLTNLLGAFHPGDHVQVGVTGAAGQRTVTITLADGPAA